MVHGFQLLQNMGKTFKLMSAEIKRRMMAQGISITREQGMVLKRLMEEDGLSQNVLARETNRDKTSAARLIARMEKNGLISRKTDARDGRVKLIFLTKKGKKVAGKIIAILNQISLEFLGEIPKSQQHQTYKTLHSIQEKLKQVHQS